jgi:ABC-type multidrug transport system fused ATPase/permease subunit
MSTGSKAFIRSKMLEKSTEDLIEIWVKNDREEWSDLAFEVVGEVLHQRIGDLPDQEQPEKRLEEASIDRERLSMIANRVTLISWVVLVVAIVYLCWGALSILTSGSASPQNFLLALASILMVAILGLSLFGLLQALSSIILVLADIRDNTQRAAKAPKNSPTL